MRFDFTTQFVYPCVSFYLENIMPKRKFDEYTEEHKNCEETNKECQMAELSAQLTALLKTSPVSKIKPVQMPSTVLYTTPESSPEKPKSDSNTVRNENTPVRRKLF